jgi:uncharacterized OB-fold protein
MTVDTESIHTFKSPAKSKWADAYWEGARRGELVVQRCDDCGTITHPPGQVCAQCLSDKRSHVGLSGLGTVYSYTVTTRPMHEEFAADAPYTIVYVQLDEGVRIVSWLQDAEPTPDIIGTRVRVVFERIDDETYLHRFVPIDAH